MTVMLVFGLTFTVAQNQAEIKFDKVTYDFGTFSDDNPVHKTTFTFTNVGKAPLVINQIVASCGCTIPNYDKRPIAPYQKGTIDVTYNGTGKFWTLQEEYYRTNKWKSRDDPTIYRRCHDW